MRIYTCKDKKAFGGAHPCIKALNALDEAGHTYEQKYVDGGVLKLWTLPNRGRDRAEVEQLSGQRSVPILVLDGGEVITGSGKIVEWAKQNSPAP
jgi:glutathione S-transferase